MGSHPAEGLAEPADSFCPVVTQADGVRKRKTRMQHLLKGWERDWEVSWGIDLVGMNGKAIVSPAEEHKGHILFGETGRRDLDCLGLIIPQGIQMHKGYPQKISI